MLEAGVSEAELLSEDADMLLETLDVGRREWLVTKFVAMSVARLSGCQTYYESLLSSKHRRSDRKRIHFAGYRPDVENAEWLFTHILQEASKAVHTSGLETNRQKEDMLATFGSTVAKRINELADLMDNAREEEGIKSGHDLVIVRDAKVEEYMSSLGLDLVGSNTRGRDTGMEASGLGHKAGQSVSLGRPVSYGGRILLPSS